MAETEQANVEEKNTASEPTIEQLHAEYVRLNEIGNMHFEKYKECKRLHEQVRQMIAERQNKEAKNGTS